MKLAVGDSVVYAAHGTGRVTAHELRTVLGVEQEVVVLQLGQGLLVTLPIARARARLRPVASRADVRRVRQTLRAEAEASEEGWQKRLKHRRAKLASGELLGLAEIVRDGIRQGSREGTASKLSGNERTLYLQARQLLAQEIGSACGLEPSAADAWIEEQAAP